MRRDEVELLEQLAFAVGSDVAHLRVEALLSPDVIREAVEDAAILTHAAQIDLAERLPVIGFAISGCQCAQTGIDRRKSVQQGVVVSEDCVPGDGQPRRRHGLAHSGVKQPWDCREPIRAEVVIRRILGVPCPRVFPDLYPFVLTGLAGVGSE